MELLITAFALFILMLCVIVGFLLGAAAMILKMVKGIVRSISRVFDVF